MSAPRVYRAAYCRAPRVSVDLPRAYRVARRVERIGWPWFLLAWLWVAFCAVVGSL